MNIKTDLTKENFKNGRGGVKPDVIVVHIMEGSMSGTDAWFKNPASDVSAHYGVSKTGNVVQWVDDEDTAQHAGIVDKPSAAIVKERPGKNPNSYTLGIECEGKATETPPLPLLTALAELVRVLAERHEIPLTRRHVIGHREIRAGKTCPCKIDVDTVVKMALALAKAAAPVDKD